MVPNWTIRTQDIQTTRSFRAYDIVDRENACPSPQLTPPPVLITSIDNSDDVSAIESKLSRFGRFEGMQRSYTRDQYRRSGIHRTNELLGGMGLSGEGVGLDVDLWRN
jgi:hypothetical protein